MTGFVELSSNTHSYLTEDSDENKKNKRPKKVYCKMKN